VADPLEVRDRLDDGDDQAKVSGGRRAGREDAAALLVDADLHLVDLRVGLGHLEPELAIRLGQSAYSAVELVLDETAHRQHRVPDALEIFVEAPRDVVTQILDFHRPTPPRDRGSAPDYTTARADGSRTASPPRRARREAGKRHVNVLPSPTRLSI